MLNHIYSKYTKVHIGQLKSQIFISFLPGERNMKLEKKLKSAKVPMTVVHFDENFETMYTEEYNLKNFELSEWQIEGFARILLPSIREYYKEKYARIIFIYFWVSRPKWAFRGLWSVWRERAASWYFRDSGIWNLHTETASFGVRDTGYTKRSWWSSIGKSSWKKLQISYAHKRKYCYRFI